MPNQPAAIAALIDDLHALGVEITIGVDVVGGIAGLIVAMLQAAELHLRHVPSLAVNRARQGTTGGEAKSDPKGARVIADQVRQRRDLRPIDRRPSSISRSGSWPGGAAIWSTSRPGASPGCATFWWRSSPSSSGAWISPPSPGSG